MGTARPNKNRKAARRRWRALKRRRYDEARALLGGRCVRCGKTSDLEIDHVDPSTKALRITDALTRRQEVRLAELAKCQLLCTDCHADKTWNHDTAEPVPF